MSDSDSPSDTPRDLSSAVTPDPESVKIFPRNLTARADYLVRGNPANSRPESGVDNCYPGLEFDQRNLEQRFFPGLAFEYQRNEGAILTSLESDRIPVASLAPQDLSPERPLYLWYVYGRTAGDRPDFYDCHGVWGMEVWNHVRDLSPGRIAIIIGPGPVSSVPPSQAAEMLGKAYSSPDPKQSTSIVRDSGSSALHYALLAGDRARYLDENGVIETEAYGAGDLTRTMCAPWIYDFRDCYCYYWAANKPDLVSSSDGQSEHIQFLRKDRSIPPPTDSAVWNDHLSAEMGFDEMLQFWSRLPIILGDRETATADPGATHNQAQLTCLTRDQVVAELTYLATVEHALMVEYLYAMYSLKSPTQFGGIPDDAAGRILAAAGELFEIAVDEMRHFLWSNQLLRLFGALPSTARARFIAEPPQAGSGRKIFAGKKYLHRPFSLRPLDADTLRWFIDVEEPSKAINQGLDGMYVELLHSVKNQPSAFPEAERAAPIIKLIIDEGVGHYRRFVGIQEALKPLRPEQYLAPLGQKANEQDERYLSLCDVYYGAVLDAVQISFTLGEHAGSVLIRDAVRSMESLDDVARMLAARGVAPRFETGERSPSRLSHEEALARVQLLGQTHQNLLDSIQSDPSQEFEHLELHREKGSQLFQRLGQTVLNDLHST